MRLSGPILETGNDGNLPHLHAADDFRAVDFLDTGRAMGIIGLDLNLPALPGARIDADRLQRDCQKAARHLLAGRDDSVIFARIVERRTGTADLRHVLHPAHQLVGLAGHGRNDHGNLIACLDLAFDVARHIIDAFQIGHRCAAEFHHDARHLRIGPAVWKITMAPAETL